MRRGLAITLLTVLIAWFIAQWALQSYLLAQGTRDLQRVAQGHSQSSFEFDQLRDLIGAHIEDAVNVRIADGVLSAHLPDGRANVRLNLRGLALDTSRFDQLQARIEVSAAAQLLLIFDEPLRLDQLSFQLELKPGWNTVQLALNKLSWSPLKGSGVHPWGGASARVGEFRLFIAGPPHVQIGLDYLRFTDGYSATHKRELVWISAAQASQRLHEHVALRPDADTFLGVRLNVGIDTPEWGLHLRDRVRTIDSEALFWPADSASPSPTQASSIAWNIRSLSLAAYCLLLLIARWQWHSSSRAHSAIQLTIGFGPLLVLSLGLGLGEQASPQALAWLGAALVYQVSGLRLQSSTWTGSRLAWRATLTMTACATAVLLLVGMLTEHGLPADAQRALQYVPFVALQQALLLGFLLPRAANLVPGAHARTLAAALFATAHAPNFALMLLSMLAAWWWITLFQRHRAWLPILLSHYVLGLLAISCLPPWLLYSAETSLRYFQVQ